MKRIFAMVLAIAVLTGCTPFHRSSYVSVTPSSYLDYLLRVKTYCRLVQDKNLWVADKSLSKTYSLSITF